MRFRKCPALGALCAAPFTIAALAAAPATDTPEVQALHLDWLDEQASPAQDFYQYANGGWKKEHPIPPEYARWGTFEALRLHTQKVVRGILERAAADTRAERGSTEQKIGDFYASGMDEAAVDAAGATPLDPELRRIDDIASREDLEKAIAHLHLIGVGAAFSFGAMQDYADSDRVIGAAFQGGLGLPDRTYYLSDTPDLARIRTEYVGHVGRMLGLLGASAGDTAAEAAAILSLETDLAKASLPRAALRDPHATYHMMNRTELARLTPSFSWERYFADVGRPDIQRIDVGTPAFFEALDADLQCVPLADWKSYLRWHLAGTFAPYLSRPFQEESFRLRAVLTDAKKMRPRWQRVLDAEDEALGFAVGKKYVEEAFPASAKESAVALLRGIRGALEQDLATLSWMSEPTRAAALEKLGMMGERIGYPEKWRDYAGLEVDRGPWVLDVLRGKVFDTRRELDKIGRPVDRSEWEMTPQTVNAYYDPSMNDINFPAAILQPPFFDPAAPVAVNYGAVGFVMGHEMTHGFDDEGAQFDGRGNLRDWWTPEDLARFHALTACIAQQFSGYEVEGVHLDGALVTGEAVADLGGWTLAYRAFHADPAAGDAPTIVGFTPDQQFFLAGAHVWASNARPEETRLRATTDPHPPPLYRVNGTVANMPAFQAAFQVPADSPMVNKDRCVIW
jgi:putative endopeptidase